MPVRKRRKRARADRRRAPQRVIYFISFLILLGLVALTVQVCRRSPKPNPPISKHSTGGGPQGQPSPADADQVAARYNAALTKAGGDELWLKRPARPIRHTNADRKEPASAGEALVLASASQAILSALQQQAATDDLHLAVRNDPQRDAPLNTAVSLWRGRDEICAWRLREVPRLYRAAIVIDDLGQDLKPLNQILKIPYPLTFSVLPDLPASQAAAAQAHQSGHEVMLHLPMEPLASTGMSPGKGALRVGMLNPEVDRVIEADLESVPYVAGVNNHMGSRATSDPALMAEVMRELAGRRLYFIDSRTAASSVALEVARRSGIPAFYRSVFLDDTASVEYTADQLRRFRAAVRTQGVALAIGHPHATTIAALAAHLPEFDLEDIELVPVSRLVKLPESARLAPPYAAPKRNGD